MDIIYDPYKFFELLGAVILIALTYLILFPQLRAKFKLYYSDTETNKRRINKCPDIKRGYFFPSLYLGSGHLQAFFGGNSRYHDPNIAFNYELLDVPGGGKIALHWGYQPIVTKSSQKNAKDCLIIILPGLTASSHDPYLRNISSEAIENGYKVVVYHPRGNQCELIFPEDGFVDYAKDLKFSIDYVKSKYPKFKLFAIGHSYGANVLVNYLSEYKDNNPILAASTAANPFHFWLAGEPNQGNIYDKWLADIMINWAKKNEKAFKSAPARFNFDWEKAMKARRLQDFDDAITARLLGYGNKDKYYDEFSSYQRVKDIKIPFFAMNSADDPILHKKSIPIKEFEKNENCILMVTNTGGHVGWFHGNIRPKRWYPKPAVQFLNCCYEEITTNTAAKN